MHPKFKVTIDGTDYESETFTALNVKRRSCNYDVATLYAADSTQALYAGAIAKFDDATVNLKADVADAYTLVFGGKVRQINPAVSPSGKQLTVNCKGYGAYLEETHCNRDYGIESSNPSYPKPWNIWTNVIDEFVEKSFDGAATGHVLDHTLITDTYNTDIKYLNNPYRANIEIIDTVCNLTCAIGAGATAGAEWIVDPEGYFMVAKIGDHAAGAGSPEARWPDWWNTNQAGSTLIEGVDFYDFHALDKAEEYANHIILATDFRRPSYDYWTEDSGGATLWGNDSLTSVSDSNTQVVVGSHSLKIDPNGAAAGYAYYPSTADADFDVTTWGSTKTIPHLNFYMWKNNTFTEATSHIYMSTNTTARKTDYFYCPFSTWTDPDDTWIHRSIPIGPYWASNEEESKQYRWTANAGGSPDWSQIDSIEFMVSGGGADALLYIDDLHFSGKVIRSASHAASIAAYGEYQKVLIARNAMDDSCIASDDTGFAGRIAYAELLRRLPNPQTITFTTTLKPTMMPGQKCHIHAYKKSDGSYVSSSWTNGGDMRILTVEHNMDFSGATTTVTATTDLLNSQPINQPDQYAMWQENMFVNSNEAKNIRAGAEVDLLIPMLAISY